MVLGLGITGIASGVRALQVLTIPDPPAVAVFSRPPPRPVYTPRTDTSLSVPAPPTTTPPATTPQATTAETTTARPPPAQTTTLSAPVPAPAPARTAHPPVYTSPLAPPSRKATITRPPPPPAPAPPAAVRAVPRPQPSPAIRAAPPAPAPAVGPQGARIAAYARELAGTVPKIPYVWGGKTPAGFDCSGFIFYVLHHLGITDTYRDSAALAAWGTHVSASNAQPGDLAYWPGHVAIFLGNGLMADAGNTRVDVSVRPLRTDASFARVPA